jgi:hypothetical protein
MGERIRIGIGRSARNDEWIATQEAADERVIQSCAEVREAQRRKRIPAIPLLTGVGLCAGLGPFGVRLTERLIVHILHERARLIGHEPIAATLTKRKGPWIIRCRAMPSRHHTRAWNGARDNDLLGSRHQLFTG